MFHCLQTAIPHSNKSAVIKNILLKVLKNFFFILLYIIFAYQIKNEART